MDKKKTNENDNLINYTGKLNEHEDYLKMLEVLEKKCDYIEIVYENEIVEKFKDDIILTKDVSEWWSQKILYKKETLYRIKATRKLFDFLRKYETFCKYIQDGRKTSFGYVSDSVVKTDFGVSDIAFFDKNGKILLKTITHEGFIDIDKDLDI